MPLSFKAKKKLKLNLPQLSGTNPIYELGSGWGDAAFLLAKQYPQVPVIAFERSWIPWAFSVIKNFFTRCPNLYFFCKDFREVSLKDAQLIYCYLFPKAMEDLNQKFRKELSQNTLIISFTFALPTWEPETVITVNDLYHSPLFFYFKIPSKALSTASTVLSLP